MSYDAKVFNVMIASPSDISVERTLARDIIYEWNVVHSMKRNIVMLPVGWETHTSPEMGYSPQDIINKQILEKCDLLIGIFWTRIGTKTDKFASGTVEEIERHIESKNPVMLYFSNSPVHPDSVDQKQYQELKEFKKKCERRGLCEAFNSPSDFKDKFYRHLQLKINEHELFSNIETASDIKLTITEKKTEIPELTKEARTLLLEASSFEQGYLLCLHSMGGTEIKVENTFFVHHGDDRRTVARWEAAIEELVEEELIVDRSYKNEVFEVTHRGYQIADLLRR